MRLLALDTSTPVTAVALLADERLVGERQVEAGGRGAPPTGGHSRGLLDLVDELLREASWARRDLEAVAAGVGPGSFTGIRIGLTLAKTLAWAGGLHLVGISSLRALAENGRDLEVDEICPALDALKGEVFCARLRGPALMEPEDARAPEVWARSLAASPARRAFLGSGALRYQRILADVLGKQACIPDEPARHQLSAAALGRLGAARLARGERDDPRELEPVYCRLSEAELGARKAQSVSPR